MEGKFSPDIDKMSLEEQQGAASALKRLAERRFQRFDRDSQEMIEKDHYEEDDLKKTQRNQERHGDHNRQI